MVDTNKIKAGKYTNLVSWQESPLRLNDPADMIRRKEQRKANPDLPSIDNGPGFRTTLLDGTVLDFTYDSEEEFQKGMSEFYSPENLIRLLAEIVGREEVI